MGGQKRIGTNGLSFLKIRSLWPEKRLLSGGVELGTLRPLDPGLGIDPPGDFLLVQMLEKWDQVFSGETGDGLYVLNLKLTVFRHAMDDLVEEVGIDLLMKPILLVDAHQASNSLQIAEHIQQVPVATAQFL